MRFASPPKTGWLSSTRAAAALGILKEHGGSEPADSAADRNEIVRLASVDRACYALFELPVTHGMRGGHHVIGVAVGVAIVADAAISIERVGRRDRSVRAPREEKSCAGEQRTVHEVAARNGLVHAKPVVRCHATVISHLVY